MPEEDENLVLSGGSNVTYGPGGEKPAGDKHIAAIRDDRSTDRLPAVIELGVDGKESSAATNPGEMPEEGDNLVLSGGSHAGNATNGPGGEKPAGDTHIVAIRDVTAASEQTSSTGMGRSANVPTTSRDSAVSMRPRTVRVSFKHRRSG